MVNVSLNAFYDYCENFISPLVKPIIDIVDEIVDSLNNCCKTYPIYISPSNKYYKLLKKATKIK